MVNVGKVAPKAQEAFLQFCVVVVGEVAEEAAYHFALLFGEVGNVVQFVNVTQVGKHAVGICHVLVDIVEVGQKQLPPAVELV